MTNENRATMIKLMEDEEFVQQMAKDEMSAEKMHDLLLGKGIDIPAEELDDLCKQGLQKIAETGASDELGDAEMEDVSGGGWVKAIYKCFSSQWKYAQAAQKNGEDITSLKFRAKLFGVGFVNGILGFVS